MRRNENVLLVSTSQAGHYILINKICLAKGENTLGLTDLTCGNPAELEWV